MSLVSRESYRQGLILYYRGALKYDGDTEVLSYSFALRERDRGAVVSGARMGLPCTDGSEMWFLGSVGHAAGSAYEVGKDHEHQFVGIFDSVDDVLLEMVCSAYHYHHFVAPLGYGHTFPITARRLVVRGFAGMIVLDADLYQHFDEGEVLIAGIRTVLHSVVPITAAELELKRRDGVDALLEQWDAVGHDVLHIPDHSRT